MNYTRLFLAQSSPADASCCRSTKAGGLKLDVAQMRSLNVLR